MNKFKLALCQIKTTENKLSNLKKAYNMIREAVDKGAEVCALGEMFNCPYNINLFKSYAESVNDLNDKDRGMDSILSDSKSPSIEFLRRASQEFNILLVGGSIPEERNGKIYNTSFIFDKGELLGTYSKIHMFDINLPSFKHKESDIVQPGEKMTVLSTRFCKIGVGICYDIRFAEFAMAMRREGAELLIYPSVFAMKTGPKYFEPFGRTRALDTQCYIATPSNARYIENTDYTQSWAHSALFDPTGHKINGLKENEGLIVEDIDLDLLAENRATFPYTSYQIRDDLYTISSIKNK